jgi:hypothetical protein
MDNSRKGAKTRSNEIQLKVTATRPGGIGTTPAVYRSGFAVFIADAAPARVASARA